METCHALAIGVALLIAGAVYEQVPDRDIGVSLITAAVSGGDQALPRHLKTNQTELNRPGF